MPSVALFSSPTTVPEKLIVPVPAVNVVYFSLDPTAVLSVPVVNPDPTVIS